MAEEQSVELKRKMMEAFKKGSFSWRSIINNNIEEKYYRSYIGNREYLHLYQDKLKSQTDYVLCLVGNGNILFDKIPPQHNVLIEITIPEDEVPHLLQEAMANDGDRLKKERAGKIEKGEKILDKFLNSA